MLVCLFHHARSLNVAIITLLHGDMSDVVSVRKAGKGCGLAYLTHGQHNSILTLLIRCSYMAGEGVSRWRPQVYVCT